MKRLAWVGGIATLLVCGLHAGAARAQLQAFWSGERLLSGQPANLFAHWQGDTPFYGALLTVPSDWSVHRAWAVVPGRPPTLLRLDTLAAGRFALQPARPLTGSLILCIEVTPDLPGIAFWQLTPRASPAGPYPTAAQRQPLLVQAADTKNPNNYVLELQRRAWALPIADTLLAWLDLQHPFTLAFWFKSTTRGAVVLSTWNGDETQSYPLELELDEAGFLRVYRGRPGQHLALSTPRPVADGTWHHIALTYNPTSGWSHLYLDAQPVDSLFTPEAPFIPPPKTLVIGGRPGSAPTATRFEGALDLLVLDRHAWSAMQIRQRFRQANPPVDGFRMDFEEPALRLPQGLRRRHSNLFFLEPLRHLTALQTEDGHVLLSCICTDQQTRALVIERSTDGRAFVQIAYLPVTCEGQLYTFQDPVPPEKPVLYYRIQQEFEGGVRYPSAVLKLGLAPTQTNRALLLGNFPNPFQGRTTIQYTLDASMPVHLSIWDLSGHEVRVLVDAVQAAGQYVITFDAAGLPSGTYFLRLKTPEGVQTHQMILIR